MTCRSGWSLMGHELIYENSSRAWLGDKAESPTTPVVPPHRSGRSPNCPSIPRFYEAPDPRSRQVQAHDQDVILPDGMNLNQELIKQGW